MKTGVAESSPAAHPSRRPPKAGRQDEVAFCGKLSDPHGEEPATAGVSGRCSASPGEPCRPSTFGSAQRSYAIVLAATERLRAHFAFFAFAFFALAAFFTGFSFAFFSGFAAMGVLAAMRIERA